MSYKVLALKWRPQKFSDLVGQKSIQKVLTQALKNERLPQALIFNGPRGTGKTSTARILAKNLRCPQAKNFEACGVCPECTDIADGRSLNVLEIDGASNNGVESVRELRESIKFQASSGKHKVYIIDEVHMLSGSAFNALLKTLEEPPEHITFILATTEIHKIPKTILSRCHRFDFSRINLNEIVEALKKITLAESYKADESALWTLARLGEGSMRDSLSLLDQALTFSEDNTLTSELLQECLGLMDRKDLLQLFENVLNNKADEVISQLEHILSFGISIKNLMKDFLEEIKFLILIKNKTPTQYIPLPSFEVEHLQKMAPEYELADLHMIFDMGLKVLENLAQLPGEERLVLEMGFLKLCHFNRIEKVIDYAASQTQTSATSSAQAPKALTPKMKPAPAAELPKPAPEAPAPNLGDDTAPQWEELIDRIGRINPKMGAELKSSAYVWDWERRHLSLSSPNAESFLVESLNSEKFQKALQNYLKTFTGEVFSLEIKTQLQSLSPIDKKKQNDQKSFEELKKKVKNHPQVLEVEKHFDIEIKSIDALSP